MGSLKAYTLRLAKFISTRRLGLWLRLSEQKGPRRESSHGVLVAESVVEICPIKKLKEVSMLFMLNSRPRAGATREQLIEHLTRRLDPSTWDLIRNGVLSHVL